MRYTDAEMDDLAYELQGTCQSLEAALEARDWLGADSDLEFCRALDDRVFCCADCGWWDEAGAAIDRSHDLICVDCDDE